MNDLPTEIMFKIFEYMRPSDRIDFISKNKNLQPVYNSFIKTCIFPKLFKALRPNGMKTYFSKNKIYDVKFSKNNDDKYVFDKLINTTFEIVEYKPHDYIIPRSGNGLDHFIIIGKNITKVEFIFDEYSGYSCYYLKSDIVKFKPNKFCIPYTSTSYINIRLKIYADSIDKIFAKEYIFEYDTCDFLYDNCIMFPDMIYKKGKVVYSGLFFLRGLCRYRYFVNEKTIHSKDPFEIEKVNKFLYDHF